MQTRYKKNSFKFVCIEFIKWCWIWQQKSFYSRRKTLRKRNHWIICKMGKLANSPSSSHLSEMENTVCGTHCVAFAAPTPSLPMNSLNDFGEILMIYFPFICLFVHSIIVFTTILLSSSLLQVPFIKMWRHLADFCVEHFPFELMCMFCSFYSFHHHIFIITFFIYRPLQCGLLHWEVSEVFVPQNCEIRIVRKTSHAPLYIPLNMCISSWNRSSIIFSEAFLNYWKNLMDCFAHKFSENQSLKEFQFDSLSKKLSKSFDAIFLSRGSHFRLREKDENCI